MSAVSHRMLVVATAGAGGDLQPLVAAALALRSQGHEVFFVGDGSVERALRGLNVPSEVLPRELDLGPRLVAAIRDATASTGGDLVAAGPMVRERMTVWAQEVARPVADIVRERAPAAIVTSLFGVEVLHAVAPSWPLGRRQQHLLRRAQPAAAARGGLRATRDPADRRIRVAVESADLVLHATDPVFDFSFDRLPERHRYVGPLGIWEPPDERPAYLVEPGDRWALVTISSQLQDDMPLAEAALEALASRASGSC